MNSFILNSLYTAMVTWIVATSTTNLNEAIAQRISNPAGQRAAVWGASFAVSFATAFSIYLLLKLVFGYGGGLLALTQQQAKQRDQIGTIQQRYQARAAAAVQKGTRQGTQQGTAQGARQGIQQAGVHAQKSAQKAARHAAKAATKQAGRQQQAVQPNRLPPIK